MGTVTGDIWRSEMLRIDAFDAVGGLTHGLDFFPVTGTSVGVFSGLIR